ncbi:hypothetical protein [Mycolicibacterium sp. XJ1819]
MSAAGHGVDEALHALIRAVADELADRIAVSLAERINADAAADVSPTPSLPPRVKPGKPQRTCEVCGRVGEQRFVETATGWKCSPTAKCVGNRQASPALTSVNGSGEHTPAQPVQFSTGITAKCLDCTRTFSVEGQALQAAVDHHENATGHMVQFASEAAS